MRLRFSPAIVRTSIILRPHIGLARTERFRMRSRQHPYNSSDDDTWTSGDANGTRKKQLGALDIVSDLMAGRPIAGGIPLLRIWTFRETAGTAVNLLLLLLMKYMIRISGMKDLDLFYLYYQPFAPFLAMLWLWGLNVWYFERHGVRYDLCFSTEHQRLLIPSSSLFLIANVLSSFVLSSGCIFLFCCVTGRLEVAAMQPPFLYSVILAALLLPAGILFKDARHFFAVTLWRVITPVRGVSWADFLLADVLTSLAKGISDTERAVCHMVTGPIMSPIVGACDDSSWLIPAGLALPYAWRLVQCLRIHAESGSRAQLLNAIKYSTAFPVIALSAVKYHVSPEIWRSLFKPLWLLAALLNSAYSFYWDVERDWEISFFSQMRSQKTLLSRPILPPSLLYPRPFYIYLVVSNAVLRLSWTYKLSPHLRRNHAAVFGIVLAEAFRRFQWMFARTEVELRRLQVTRPELGQLVPVPSRTSDLSSQTLRETSKVVKKTIQLAPGMDP